MKQDIRARFWSNVKRDGDCWIWIGIKRDGYGRVRLDGRNRVSAHRVAYEWRNGPIPDGYLLDHICLTRACVNPDHLRPVTRKQNAEHRGGANANSKSGIRGVHWVESKKRWRTSVNHNGKRITAGSFTDRAEAEEAVRNLRSTLFTHDDAA